MKGDQSAKHMSSISKYNQLALEISKRVHAERQHNSEKSLKIDRSVERKFPKDYRPGFGVAMEYQTMGNRPVSPETQRLAKSLNLELEHLGITLGTIISGCDLKKPLNNLLIKCLRQIFLERKVIFFRNQEIDQDQLARFAKYFGELDAFPFGKGNEKNPFVLEIVHGENSPGSENGWHTDVTWMENPSLGSVAQCIELPPYGGDTLFSDSHACYLGMPERLKNEVRDVWGTNDYRLFLKASSSNNLSDELTQDIKSKFNFGVDHPILRTHPETKKTGLYLNGSFLRSDSLYNKKTNRPVGEERSRALIKELLRQHDQPEYSCRFRWESGSIAFWDNRAVQHFAASDYYPHRRVLRRVTISGDKPYFDPNSDRAYISQTSS